MILELNVSVTINEDVSVTINEDIVVCVKEECFFILCNLEIVSINVQIF